MTESTVETLKLLIGNPDVYAVQGDPAKDEEAWRPVRRKLTTAVLRRHLRGAITIGTYIVKPPDQARTLVFDIDDEDEDEQKRQLEVILDVIDRRLGLGKKAGVEWSGGKGYHVWLVAKDYMPAELLYRLGRGVRELAELPKLEVFPKQTQVKDLGSLVKLPGSVHRKTGNEHDFTTLPRPIMVKELTRLAEMFPEVRATRAAGDAPPMEFPCVYIAQEGVEEGGRNTVMFHLATMLRRKGCLTDENLEAVLRRVNEKNVPPLEEEELIKLIDGSRNSGPICRQLPDDVSCGDQCVFQRSAPGLYTRNGALKWADAGEKVVIEVIERTPDGVLEIEHPDIEQGRIHLREVGKKRRR